MLLSYIANPASSSRMRKSAIGCLELLSRCIGTTLPRLAATYMEHHSKELISRRWACKCVWDMCLDHSPLLRPQNGAHTAMSPKLLDA